MSGRTYSCSRCETSVPVSDDHTEIVRRDFVEFPRVSRVERLCRNCWEAYVDEFLGRDFESLLDEYDAHG